MSDHDRARAPTLRFASLTGSEDATALAAEQLTDREKARALRFLRQADRERFALGRWLLGSMLASMFGVRRGDLELDPGGKPFLPAEPDIAFNISHSGDLVLVGIGTGMEIGVDVERHRDDVDLEGVGRLIFAPHEAEVILQGTPEERRRRFFRHWALKEALVKGLGTGLMRDPRRFAIDPSGHPPEIGFVGNGVDDIGAGWIVRDVPVAGRYSAAVAWRLAEAEGEKSPRAEHG